MASVSSCQAHIEGSFDDPVYNPFFVFFRLIYKSPSLFCKVYPPGSSADGLEQARGQEKPFLIVGGWLEWEGPLSGANMPDL